MPKSINLPKPKDWTDEDRGRYLDSLKASKQQKKQTCGMCGGKGHAKGWKRGSDGKMEARALACFDDRDTAQQAWEAVVFYLNQFITCPIRDGTCGDPRDAQSCEGSMCERHQVLNVVYHYGQRVAAEKI